MIGFTPRPTLGLGVVSTFGKGATTWAEKMVDSYIALHGPQSDNVVSALRSRLARGSYLHTNFGPGGTYEELDACTFVMMFEHTEGISSGAKTVDKTGALPHWETSEGGSADNTLGPDTTVAGVYSVSSVDGWSALRFTYLYNPPFTGPFPNLEAIGGTDSFTRIVLANSAFSVKTSSLKPLESLQRLRLDNIGSLVVDGDFMNAEVGTYSGGSEPADFTENGLSASEVDTLLGYIADAVAIIDLSDDYNFDFSSNSPPTATGLAHIATIEGWNWAGSGGSVVITVDEA